MLKPLFDRNAELVGWVDPGKYIFDADFKYVAYISNGSAWSARNGTWLGPMQGLNLLDTLGRTVAWSPGEKLLGISRPARPAKPPLPIMPALPARLPRPVRPGVPAPPPGGWSSMGMRDWTAQ